MKSLLFIISHITFITLLSGCNPAVTSTPASNPSPVTTTPPPTPTTPELPKKDNPHAAVQQQLTKAKAKWQQHKNAHYIYTLQRSCFCPPEARKPMRVRVKDNAIAQVLLVPENISKPINYAGALPVSRLFAIVQEAIDNNAASIKVRYDARYGYPIDIAIDKDKRIADEELYYKASGMRLL